MKDQNMTVHDYIFDQLGRQVLDKADNLGTGIASAVRAIGWTYNALGRQRVESRGGAVG